MGKKMVMCDACGNYETRYRDSNARYGVRLCGVCHVEAKETDEGTVVYLVTLGEKPKIHKVIPKK